MGEIVKYIIEFHKSAEADRQEGTKENLPFVEDRRARMVDTDLRVAVGTLKRPLAGIVRACLANGDLTSILE